MTRSLCAITATAAAPPNASQSWASAMQPQRPRVGTTALAAIVGPPPFVGMVACHRRCERTGLDTAERNDTIPASCGAQSSSHSAAIRNPAGYCSPGFNSFAVWRVGRPRAPRQLLDTPWAN